MKTIWSILILALAAVTVAGCTASGPAASPTVAPTVPASTPTAPVSSPTAPVATPTAQASPTASVSIKDFSFQPDTVTIARGGTVTWTNNDGTTHTVTFADGQANNLPGGGTYSRTFDAAGSFDYHCSIHPSMHGTVKVV